MLPFVLNVPDITSSSIAFVKVNVHVVIKHKTTQKRKRQIFIFNHMLQNCYFEGRQTAVRIKIRFPKWMFLVKYVFLI